MNTERAEIRVSGLTVQIVRKEIKNLHLGVYPPNGRVRVAAPLAVSNEAVRLAVVGKLAWIRRQRAGFEAQPRQSAREMVSGESHYFLGRRYRLHVASRPGPTSVVRRKAAIELRTPPGTSAEQRQRALEAWYRRELKAIVSPLVARWQADLGVDLSGWGIKRMKTRWGGCNGDTRLIWLNLELAKKPAPCIEYIVVHELVHLFAPHHDDRFVRTMDEHLPQWRALRQELNAAPLSHETWAY